MVLEAGLGAKLDATNIVDPLLSIVTTIGLDHEKFLGNTLESVAQDKSKIIKFKKPVILGSNV